MREILFKNLSSPDKKQRNLFVAETLQNEGILCHSERRTIYVIKDRRKITDPLKLEKELSQLQKSCLNPRQIFITKKFNTQKKIKEFSYSIIGRFYALVGKDIYTIAFKHSFKFYLKDLS